MVAIVSGMGNSGSRGAGCSGPPVFWKGGDAYDCVISNIYHRLFINYRFANHGSRLVGNI